MQRWLDSADRRFCKAIISFRRRTFTSSGTLSSRCLEAYVPGRSEYLNMKAASYPHSSIRESERAWSSSVSEWKPENISVVSPQSGMIRLIAATRSRYHSRVYLRFISFRIRELPLCTGRWICLHTLGTCAITSSVSSLISFG